jgi:phenylacetate-CoA ligase
MSFRDSFTGNVLFPVSNMLLNRKGILSQYRGFVRTERYSEEILRELQLKKLLRTLEYANKWVPYYTKKFRDMGMEPSDIKNLKDISCIPPLTRQEVVEHYAEMIDVRHISSVAVADRSKRSPGEPLPLALFRKHRLVRNTSSGSTGAPTVFYEDGSRTAMNWAYELQLKSWFDVPPGAREARMARLSTAYVSNSRSVMARKCLWNQLVLPGVNLTEQDYALCLKKLMEFRPQVLWGFTSALTGLAEFIRMQKGDRQFPWLKLILTWAAPLYEHEKDLLEKVFGAAVSNIYGAREVGHIAGQCPHGSFHINQGNIYLEIYADSTEEVASGYGEILTTTLDESPMPFIRYRMGDIGAIADSACSCGRTPGILKGLLGRTGEVFITADGRMISPNFWCRTFMDPLLAGAVRRFQIIYVRDDFARIRIAKAAGYCMATEQALRQRLLENFGRGMNFEIEYVDGIIPQVSGKYQMVVNEARYRSVGKTRISHCMPQ